MASKLSFFWQDGWRQAAAASGVSLHSHTSISRESIGILFEHGARNGLVKWLLDREQKRFQQRQGKPLDFNRVYWTSPVTPGEAYELEARQIRERTGLKPLVSLTDHDAIEANQLLQLTEGKKDIPISVEWTVPVENTFFHFGIHNLPKAHAADMHAAMQAYRNRPSMQALLDLLQEMVSFDDVLVILNHPMWDESGIGQQSHEAVLSRLLRSTRRYVHGLELNGLRTWKENARVLALAEETGLCPVSGGDRHGHEPNALINLTPASTFSDFVAEVRGGYSHVLMMPQYRESRKLRCFQTAWDMIREHPEHPFGKVSCLDRTYFVQENGEPAALSSMFKSGTPPLLAKVLWAVRALESPHLRPALRVALSDGEGLPS